MEEQKMAKRLAGLLSLVVLIVVMSGVGYANIIPTQITFGPSSTGTITASPISATFSGNPSGVAYQGANSWNPGYTLADATMPVVGGSGGIYTLAPNVMSFTVVIGPDSLAGTLSLNTLVIPSPNISFFVGTFTIISATPGFQSTGFGPGSVGDADFAVLNGNLSSGEIVPIPEPGTIALMGSGLIAVAGLLRRRS
jgi:PEP-CTERM motif